MTEQIGDQKATAVAAAGPSAKGTAKRGAASANGDARNAPNGLPGARPYDTRHAVLRYTTLRLALFLVALLLVWGVAVIFNMDLTSPLSKLTLLAVALLLSSAASFIALSKQRDAMSAGIVARTERLSRKFDDAASFEDDE